jgi:hypothetical protein
VRSRILATTVLAAALTSACAAPAPTPAGSQTSDVTSAVAPPRPNKAGAAATTTAATATTPAASNERGNQPRALGEPVSWGRANDASVTFAVEKITVDPECTGVLATKAQNGHIVKLEVRLDTAPTMPTNAGYSLNSTSFSAVGPDGITETSLFTAPAISCLAPNEQLPVTLAPGSKYRGAVVLDTANPAGTLIFRPALSPGGWEWQYGG